MMEKGWFNKLLIGAVGTLAGVCITLLTTVGECKIATVEIAHMKEQDRAIVDQAKADRESFDRRMAMVVALIEENTKTVRELIELDREYISLLKLQNATRP